MDITEKMDAEKEREKKVDRTAMVVIGLSCGAVRGFREIWEGADEGDWEEGIQVRSAGEETREGQRITVGEDRKQRVTLDECVFLHFLYRRRHLLLYAYDVRKHLTNKDISFSL